MKGTCRHPFSFGQELTAPQLSHDQVPGAIGLHPLCVSSFHLKLEQEGLSQPYKQRKGHFPPVQPQPRALCPRPAATSALAPLCCACSCLTQHKRTSSRSTVEVQQLETPPSCPAGAGGIGRQHWHRHARGRVYYTTQAKNPGQDPTWVRIKPALYQKS